MSLLDRSTGKVSLGRLGRRRTQTLSSFLRPWNNGQHLRFEDRRCKARPRARRSSCYAFVLGWGKWNMGVRVQVRRRHTRTATVDEDQSRAPPGPAGDGVPCLNRCWISMGRCLADRGGLIPAAGLWRHGGQQPKERRGWVYFHAFGFRGVLVGVSCRIPRMGRPSVGVADYLVAGICWALGCGQGRKDSGCSTADDGQTRPGSPAIELRRCLSGPVQHNTASARSNSDIGTRRGIWDGSTD